MTEPHRPAWHWDEVMALRMELADQVETAAMIQAALEAEVARLQADKTELGESIRFWQRQAEHAEERARVAALALARALRTAP